MKRLLFILVIALLYCNGINSLSKNDIKKEIQISDISTLIPQHFDLTLFISS